jgi:hypothetical protein
VRRQVHLQQQEGRVQKRGLQGALRAVLLQRRQVQVVRVDGRVERNERVHEAIDDEELEVCAC